MYQGSSSQTPWWEIEDEQERVDALCASVEVVKTNDQGRQQGLEQFARLYGGREFVGLLPSLLSGSGMGNWTGTGRNITGYSGWDDDRIRFNLIQSIIDTLTAKVGKNRPKPTFITDTGKWDDKVAAKDLDAWTEGAYYQAGVYDTMPIVFRDAAIFGTGILRVYRDEGKICAERVFPSEMLVDPIDALHGKPRVLYRVKLVDVHILEACFPKYREKIDQANDFTTNQIETRDVNSRKVEVIEAWHLPSRVDATDGRHIIAIDGQQLNPGDDMWTRDSFPFAFFHWSPPVAGFWGEGAALRLTSLQIEVNTLLQRIQEAFRLVAKPTIYVEEGSKIVKQHLTNQIANIVTYRGTVPVTNVPQSVHPEVFMHLDRLIQRAYEQEGVSQMSAMGKKPVGLDSGRALRTADDIETDRFSTISRNYETAYMDTADLQISEALEALEKGEPLQGVVMTRQRRGARKIDFKDIQIERDNYVMRMFPISSLSSSPAGRMEDVQDMMKAGLIQPEYGRRLLDFPDTDFEDSIDFAPLDYIDWRLSDMLTKGEEAYEDPTPIQNLQLTVIRTQKMWQRASVDGAPQDRLDLLEQYIEASIALLTPPQPVAPPMAAPMPGAPPAPQMTANAMPQGAMA